MQLNEGQAQAAAELFQFLISHDKEFCLSGPAGVGKTFMMEYIMNNLMKEYSNGCALLGIEPELHFIELTATTNKAADVLSQSTGKPAQTIHSFMNLKVFDDFSTGVSKCKKTPSWIVHTGTVLFIDEASMIDSDLHKFILEGTNSTCKIIYIGDHCQMAPVFETISPIYKSPKNFAELLEPVRNADQPALMTLCDQLRTTVKTGKFQPIQTARGVIDYIDDADLKYILDNLYHPEDVDSRVLCFTNARVGEYNSYIRTVRGYPDRYTKGEILINNSAIQLGKRMLKVEQQFRINDVMREPYLKSIDPSDESITLEVYHVQLQSPNGSESYGMEAIIPVDKNHFKELSNYYKRQKNWKMFYHLKNNYPDLRQKDAATVYKAQGSTYNSVVIDLSNIGKCTQPDQVARMLYVAASRAREQIFLYGQLPARYQQS